MPIFVSPLIYHLSLFEISARQLILVNFFHISLGFEVYQENFGDNSISSFGEMLLEAYLDVITHSNNLVSFSVCFTTAVKHFGKGE